MEDYYRTHYKIESFDNVTFKRCIENTKDFLQDDDFTIKKIVTGNGGKRLINELAPIFNHLVYVDKEYDAVDSKNDWVNPIYEYGYKLSSFIFTLYLSNNRLKCIPFNKNLIS
jgi:hypothetical protein